MSKNGGFQMIALELPMPWPPDQPWILFERRLDSYAFRLDIATDGSFTIISECFGFPIVTCNTEPIIVCDGPIVILEVAITPVSATLKANGIEIKPKTCSSGPPIVVQGGKALEKRILRFPHLSPIQTYNRNHQLFIGKVVELDQKLQSGDWYSLVAASGIMRSLIIDKNCLIHLANKDFKLALRFRALGLDTAFPSITGEYNIWCFGGPIGHTTKQVNLDDFLQSPCLIDSGKIIANVGDLIRMSANVLGGIHVDNPKKPEHLALADLSNSFSGPHRDITVNALVSVGNEILEGLLPLINAITQRQT